jgi:hypothetical protein
LVLALLGVVTCGAGAVAFGVISQTGFAIVLAVLALAAAADAVVVVRRMRAERSGAGHKAP